MTTPPVRVAPSGPIAATPEPPPPVPGFSPDMFAAYIGGTPGIELAGSLNWEAGAITSSYVVQRTSSAWTFNEATGELAYSGPADDGSWWEIEAVGSVMSNSGGAQQYATAIDLNGDVLALARYVGALESKSYVFSTDDQKPMPFCATREVQIVGPGPFVVRPAFSDGTGGSVVPLQFRARRVS